MGWIGEANSLGDLFLRCCDRYADKVAYLVPERHGHRSVTYSQAKEEVFRYARALKGAGLSGGDSIAFVCETCHAWAMTDWACQTLGVLLVPIYPTLPADQSLYIAQDCGARLALVQDERHLFKFPGMQALTLPELLKNQADLCEAEWRAQTAAVRREDLATIIYTSGTTGQPKGAMLTHAGFLDLSDSIEGTYPIDGSDTFLSFLPLSHVFERYAGHVLPMSLGATVAYAGSIATLGSDLVKVRPTIMCAVPRFFENMRQRALDGVRKQPPVRRWLVNLALRQGQARARGRLAPLFPITDRLVGKQVRERTGGRIKFFVSGGAALAPHVSEFYQAFRILVLQGYGLTETTAATCLNHPSDNRPWTVGPPIGAVEVKLADDGEILVRGSAVMKGYHGLEQATAEAIDGEGWFHTGDIGTFERGNLKITDRKKDILVLANGKNIAPQRIEDKLKESDFIAEALICGDGAEHVSALVVPNFERLRPWLQDNGLDELKPADLVLLDPVKQLFKEEVAKANQTLADFERVKRHRLLGAVFSVDGGELTPTLKLRKRFVAEKYKDDLARLLEP